MRSFSDLPWGSYAARIVLHVRKFFCTLHAGSRRIFTERLSVLVTPFARRIAHLGDSLYLLSFAVGGRARSRLGKRLHIGSSFSATLRLILQLPEQHHSMPRVLGVDE